MISMLIRISTDASDEIAQALAPLTPTDYLLGDPADSLGYRYRAVLINSPLTDAQLTLIILRLGSRLRCLQESGYDIRN